MHSHCNPHFIDIPQKHLQRGFLFLMMNYQQALEYVHSFQKFGWIFGRLERLSHLLEHLGNPHQQLKFIHIAGTNGKGSVTSMCSSMLQAAGYRCGMFISPYVIHFTERFQIDGSMITEQAFARSTQQVRNAITQVYRDNITITEFEVLTVIGFVYFAAHHCDIVCLEVGLGGGDDATNVIPPPLASVITSISLDHVAILGDTIAEIAAHKAGIIKHRAPCICYPEQHSDALTVLAQRCTQTNSRLIRPDADAVQTIKSNLYGSAFLYRGELFDIPLAGKHQILNALTAIETVLSLNAQGFSISCQQIKQGLSATSFCARFQILHTAPLVIADIAHNAQSIQGLVETLQQIRQKKIFLIGLLAEKDIHSTLELIAPQAQRMICITPDSPRALDGKVLCNMARTYGPAQFEHDYRTAYQIACQQAGMSGCIVICGSFFVMERMLPVIDELRARNDFSPT